MEREGYRARPEASTRGGVRLKRRIRRRTDILLTIVLQFAEDEMRLVPELAKSRLRWLGWALFWSAFCYLGSMQTWVFGDHADKPALADIVGPLHFWFAWVVFDAPLWPLERLYNSPGGGTAVPFTMFIALQLGWVAVLTRLVILVQDEFHPWAASLFTWGPIVGTILALFLIRATAVGASDSLGAIGSDMMSSSLLLGLVFATWLYVATGVNALALRPLLRRRQG